MVVASMLGKIEQVPVTPTSPEVYTYTSTSAGNRYFVINLAACAQLRDIVSNVVPKTCPDKKVTMLSNERKPEKIESNGKANDAAQ